MGFIYKVNNKINDKNYIGQTIHTVEWRWETHLRSAFNERMQDHNVLFHRAIRKYGIDAFEVETIEECDNELLNEKEIYWIEHYKSCGENGYNISLGGNGYYRYKDSDILKFWEMGYSASDIGRFLGCQRGTARLRLLANNISQQEIIERGNLAISESNRKKVYQYDSKTGEYIKGFYSVTIASKETKINLANIAECAQGHILSAGGYIWSYEKKDKINVIKKNNKRCLVGKYDENGKLVEAYISLTATAKNNKDIKVSRKKLSIVIAKGEKYKNFYWRFIEIENGIIKF